MYPGLGDLDAPNSGIYLFDRSRIAHDRLTGSYAVDLDVMLRIHAAGAGVTEVDIGRIVHDPRDPGHYSAMAEEILAFLLSRQPQDLLEEVVILAESGTQAARHATGLMAQKLIAGARVTACLDDAGAACRGAGGLPDVPRPAARRGGVIRPASSARAVRLIAPAEGAARAAADALAERLALPVEIWEMPGGAGWTPDTGVDPGEGADIRQAVLAQIDPALTRARRRARSSGASRSRALEVDLALMLEGALARQPPGRDVLL